MNKLPLVSVNIRTYNSAKTLKKALESIKTQTYPNIEILVSDGNSRDASVAIAKNYGASINYADKLGDARYQNYKESKGKYVLSVDSDQILDKKLIEVCVRLCEDKGFDALTIAEKSIMQRGTMLEKLIAYDKWVIDQAQDADATFGTACPRFFKRAILDKITWPKELAIFDDTILYAEVLRIGAKVSYVSEQAIRHHEVASWSVLMKKFFRYGKGYFDALKAKPTTIAAHSLPRRSYFSKPAFSKPHYFLGLLLLYGVKVAAASAGAISFLIDKTIQKK